jgi:signal transduction histidine kinase
MWARPVALLGLAAFGPLVIYAGFNGYVALTRRQAGMTQQSMTAARSLAETIDRSIAANVEDAEALAASPLLDPDAGPAGLKLWKTSALRARERHPGWLAVVLIRPDGHWEYSTEPEDAGKHPLAANPQSFAAAMTSHQLVVGDVVRGPHGRWGIPLRAPVIRDGRALGVVSVSVSPAEVRRTVANAGLPGSWITGVVNSFGHIVVREPDAADKFTGDPIGRETQAARAARPRGGGGSYTRRAATAGDLHSFYWVSSTSGWSVHVSVPNAIYEAPLREMLTGMIAGFLVCLALAASLIWLWIRDQQTARSRASAVEQATRIDALGRLTGGVAHDFNNLLTVIQGNTEILGRRLQSQPQTERPLAAIRAAADRAAKLTRQLLVFARGGPAEAVAVDLNRTIVDLLGALDQLAGTGVTVSIDAEPGLPLVSVDPLQLEAAVLNLVANARDAMAGQGVIVLRLRRQANGVELEVRDQGPGFDPALLTRVFDPFFTTKPVGQGTGLGLSQVYGLMKGAGGHAKASNGPDGGVVTLWFPALTDAPMPAPEPAFQPAHLGMGQASILLVDDNDAVRATTAAFLREGGLSVVEAPDAAHALATLETTQIEAVVSDIVMPGEDGTVLADRIKARWPTLPVLLVSGFSERAAEAQARGFIVIHKPYSLSDLERRLRGLLQRASASA